MVRWGLALVLILVLSGENSFGEGGSGQEDGGPVSIPMISPDLVAEALKEEARSFRAEAFPANPRLRFLLQLRTDMVPAEVAVPAADWLAAQYLDFSQRALESLYEGFSDKHLAPMRLAVLQWLGSVPSLPPSQRRVLLTRVLSMEEDERVRKEAATQVAQALLPPGNPRRPERAQVFAQGSASSIVDALFSVVASEDLSTVELERFLAVRALVTVGVMAEDQGLLQRVREIARTETVAAEQAVFSLCGAHSGRQRVAYAVEILEDPGLSVLAKLAAVEVVKSEVERTRSLDVALRTRLEVLLASETWLDEELGFFLRSGGGCAKNLLDAPKPGLSGQPPKKTR